MSANKGVTTIREQLSKIRGKIGGHAHESSIEPDLPMAKESSQNVQEVVDAIINSPDATINQKQIVVKLASQIESSSMESAKLREKLTEDGLKKMAFELGYMLRKGASYYDEVPGLSLDNLSARAAEIAAQENIPQQSSDEINGIPQELLMQTQMPEEEMPVEETVQEEAPIPQVDPAAAIAAATTEALADKLIAVTKENSALENAAQTTAQPAAEEQHLASNETSGIDQSIFRHLRNSVGKQRMSETEKVAEDIMNDVSASPSLAALANMGEEDLVAEQIAKAIESPDNEGFNDEQAPENAIGADEIDDIVDDAASAEEIPTDELINEEAGLADGDDGDPAVLDEVVDDIPIVPVDEEIGGGEEALDSESAIDDAIEELRGEESTIPEELGVDSQVDDAIIEQNNGEVEPTIDDLAIESAMDGTEEPTDDIVVDDDGTPVIEGGDIELDDDQIDSAFPDGLPDGVTEDEIADEIIENSSTEDIIDAANQVAEEDELEAANQVAEEDELEAALATDEGEEEDDEPVLE